jgi:hypothetical protein
VTTVAIMQPYFVPYAGYFRLFAAADVFVVLDSVQFPRRGWVHRNRLPDRAGEARWLTIPIQKAPQDVLISDVRRAADADAQLRDALRRFPIFDDLGPGHPMVDALLRPGEDLTGYLVALLGVTCSSLGLPFNVVRASSIDVEPGLDAQERILALAAAMGATHYVNASGGRALYDSDAFARRGIALRFLEPYQGAEWSVLYRALREDPAAVGAEIRAQS